MYTNWYRTGAGGALDCLFMLIIIFLLCTSTTTVLRGYMYYTTQWIRNRRSGRNIFRSVGSFHLDASPSFMDGDDQKKQTC